MTPMTSGPGTETAGQTAVFVAISLAGLRSLRELGTLPGPIAAHGVTDALLAWGEFGPGEDEDAAFAAQTFAEVSALTLTDAAPDAPRLVLALPADRFTPADPDGYGLGSLPGIAWGEVLAVYADEPGTDLTAARSAARGVDLAAAWAAPEVAALVDEHELGWHQPGEVAEW